MNQRKMHDVAELKNAATTIGQAIIHIRNGAYNAWAPTTLDALLNAAHALENIASTLEATAREMEAA